MRYSHAGKQPSVQRLWSSQVRWFSASLLHLGASSILRYQYTVEKISENKRGDQLRTGINEWSGNAVSPGMPYFCLEFRLRIQCEVGHHSERSGAHSRNMHLGGIIRYNKSTRSGKSSARSPKKASNGSAEKINIIEPKRWKSAVTISEMSRDWSMQSNSIWTDTLSLNPRYRTWPYGNGTLAGRSAVSSKTEQDQINAFQLKRINSKKCI